jgi:hypothetical protein
MDPPPLGFIKVNVIQCSNCKEHHSINIKASGKRRGLLEEGSKECCWQKNRSRIWAWAYGACSVAGTVSPTQQRKEAAIGLGLQRRQESPLSQRFSTARPGPYIAPPSLPYLNLKVMILFQIPSDDDPNQKL